MKRTLFKLEIIFNLIFVFAFIGVLFFFLGLQPLRGMLVREQVWICICLACGGMLMMAVYNSTLRIFTRREKAAQYFSLLCIGQSVRFFFMPGSIGTELFPGLPPLFVALGLRYIPFCVAVIGLLMFVYEIYGEGRSKKLKYAVIASIAFINIFLPLAGLDFTIWRAILGLPVGVLVNATLIYVLVKSPLLKQDRLSLLYLFGFILYLFSWLVSITSFESAPIIAVAFNFLFAVIHSVLLSNRFARSILEVEQANIMLEDRVAERTAELRASNENLAASEKSVREVIAGLTHDLKTPMSVLSANLEVALEANDLPEAKRHLSIAYNKSADLARLIQQLLSVGSMETGKSVYNMTWAPLGPLLSDIAEKYAAQFEAEGIELNVLYRQDVDVWIDRGQILRVFDNIIGNAQRYTAKDGAIRVESGKLQAESEGGGTVTVSVSDTGPGVAPEHLPHLFEQYYKADKGRGAKGAGLGLYIVKTAVEAMAGSVAAANEAGGGLKISITLKAK